MAAYEGGYGGQHQYGGPAPRQYGNGPPPQQYGAPQQYDNQNGYGYDDYNGGHSQDPNFGRGPPPGPGRGGRPMPGGRGGPIPRPQTADPHRGRGPPPRGLPQGPGRGMPNGAGGRGGMRPGPHNAHSDPAGRQPPMSPQGSNFGGGYPPFPGQGREQQMVDQMAGMDLNGGRASFDQQRPPMNGGRGPPPRGYPPQGRGPPGGYNEYDNGYNTGGQGPPRNGFGPPARSMTMPVEDPGARNHMPPPPLQRVGTMPVNGPPGQAMPQRPSTAAGHRPPPQRRYPDEPQSATVAQYNGGYDDVYDAYFDNRDSNPGYGHDQRDSRTSVPDFDAMPAQSGRDSFEQTMRPAQEQPQQGAHQTAQLYHAKSQPSLRQPQAAVFEMANDAPPMPSMNGFQQGYDQNYPGQEFDRPPMSSTPAPMRPGGPNGPQYSNGDNLPSHPTPVRPGLMANSVVNMNNKPAPVRNYGAPTPAPQQQMQPQHQAPPPQQQQSPPQQLQPPNPPKNPARNEPPVSMQELEHLRQVIKSNPSDQDSALKLAKKLLEATDVLAPKLPDPKQRARARDRYLVDCQKILKKLSNAQNQEAMFIHADCLGKGLFGHEPDYKEAFTLYQSAAKLGHPAAAYRTAVCCEIGHEDGGGTRRDPLKAIQWYKRAATLGDPPAMYKVGMIQLKGLLGQPKNVREAVGWLKRAAERADTENPHALHELGLLYESAQANDVIIRDEQYAYNLFLQAAELGYKFSQYRLGCSYEYGLMGCPIDPRHSIMWYSRAATQGEHQSELALSGWYLTGSDGVLNQSDTEAYLWARKAAMAGLAKAEYAMGYFTEVGIGVPANLEDAKRWYWRAAAQEFPKARERLEDLKRSGKSGQRQRERISRSKIERQQEGDCTIM